MQRFAIGTFYAALTLSIAGAAQARTSITTNWRDLEVTQDECLARADRVIRRNGYSVPGTTESARHGIRGEYTVMISCSADKNLVIFVAAGPDGKFTEKYTDALVAGF